MPVPLIPILGFIASNLARVALPAIARQFAPKVISSAAKPLASTIIKKVTTTAIIGAAVTNAMRNDKQTSSSPTAPTSPRSPVSPPSSPRSNSPSSPSVSSNNSGNRSNTGSSNPGGSSAGSQSGSSQGATPNTGSGSGSSSGDSSGSSPSSPPPVKSAPIDTVVFSDEAFAEEFLTDVLFEDVVGLELLTIARNDTVNGQDVIYQPIKNLGILQGAYNPQNILGLSQTSASIFANFIIKLNEKIPTISSQENGQNFYVDEATGDIIVELVNILADEQVEFQIAVSGTIDRLGI